QILDLSKDFAGSNRKLERGLQNLHRGFDSRRRLRLEQSATPRAQKGQRCSRPLSRGRPVHLSFIAVRRGRGRSPPPKGRGLRDGSLCADFVFCALVLKLTDVVDTIGASRREEDPGDRTRTLAHRGPPP